MLESIPFKSSQNIKVLDLGCGTGHGCLLILKKFKKSIVVGIDFSEKMIKKSISNLDEFKSRVKLLEKDFNGIDFGKDYDVIVSTIAIHNSTHDQKEILFNKIFSSLRCDGVFINCDFVEGESDRSNEKYKKLYRSYLEKNLEGDEMMVWLKHAFEDDKPMKLSRQVEILKKTGFKEIKVVWKFNNELAYIAKK
jgi:tRNA (cmo5U34)-methyltransferase